MLAPTPAPDAGQTLGCDSQPALSSQHHTPNRTQLVETELVWGSLSRLQYRQLPPPSQNMRHSDGEGAMLGQCPLSK